jgi:hypothetical protein
MPGYMHVLPESGLAPQVYWCSGVVFFFCVWKEVGSSILVFLLLYLSFVFCGHSQTMCWTGEVTHACVMRWFLHRRMYASQDGRLYWCLLLCLRLEPTNMFCRVELECASNELSFLNLPSCNPIVYYNINY